MSSARSTDTDNTKISSEQLQMFLKQVVETRNESVNPRLNTLGSGKKSFTETLKKDLDTESFTDSKFKLEIAARAVHLGYFELLRCWEMSTEKIKIDDENADSCKR